MRKAWLLCAVAATSVLGADIAGSDLLKAALTEGLRQAAPASSVDFAGTLPGRRSLADGRSAAALLFQKDGEPDPSAPAGQTLQRYLLANAAVVVAVHKSNRHNQVSFADLNSLLAKDPKIYYVNWNDLAGGNLSETILTYIYAPMELLPGNSSRGALGQAALSPGSEYGHGLVARRAKFSYPTGDLGPRPRPSRRLRGPLAPGLRWPPR